MENNNEKNELEKVKERFVLWITKINKLKDEIKALNDFQNNAIINAPTLSIGVFLLKSEIT